MRSSVLFRFAALAALCATVAPAGLRADTALEMRLKAAIVSKLPQFVEWPPAALAGKSSIDICVPAGDPIGSDIGELVTGESAAGLSLAVRTIDRADQVDGCHVLFLGGRPAARRAFLTRASSAAVLTVGDDPRFLDEGGIVSLREVNGRVRFDVNVAASRKAGLRISAQLLQLAMTVREAP